MKDGSDRSDRDHSHPRVTADGVAPGKRTLTGSAPAVQRSSAAEPNATGTSGRSMSEIIPLSSDVPFADSLVADTPVQRKESGGASDADVHALAEHGTSGASGALPFMDQIQRSFGNHDVSSIKAHGDGAAVDASRAMGARAFASGDHVAFGASPDLHTAAHEAAHVVQQRGGVQLAGGVGSVGDPYEQHADAVADAVVRGESAEHLLGDASPAKAAGGSAAVQRFGANEHQMLGEAGSGGSMVELVPGYSLPFGDVVALAGDHFESIDQMREFARNTKGGKESRAEIEWARIWKLSKVQNPSSKAWHDLEAREAQEKRYYSLAGSNHSHFVAPHEKDRGATKGELSGVGNDRGEIAAARFNRKPPKNAPEGYRVNHIRAIYEAFEAAQATMLGGAGKGSDVPTLASALATEAFACHYLTDSFSAGHVRTARQDLKSHWDPKVPMFAYNLVGLMSDLIAHDLVQRGVYGIANRRYLASQARNTIEGEMAKKASFTIGDLVAGALHHGDNHDGLRTKAGGQDVLLLGDDELHQPAAKLRKRSDPDATAAAAKTTTSLASRAVAYGVNEVRQAHVAGFVKGANPIAVIEGYLNSHEDRFAAETLVPDPTAVDENDTPEAAWRTSSIETLFQDPVFESGATRFLKEQASELTGIAKSIGGAQQEAITHGVVDQLLASPLDMLRRTVHWTPGSAIANTWDAKDDASDYVGAATKKRAMGTLTLPQRMKLVKTLTEAVDEDSNPAIDSEGRPSGSIMEILKTAPPGDAQAIIAEVGYDRIREWINPLSRPAFDAHFPRQAHAPR